MDSSDTGPERGTLSVIDSPSEKGIIVTSGYNSISTRRFHMRGLFVTSSPCPIIEMRSAAIP